MTGHEIGTRGSPKFTLPSLDSCGTVNLLLFVTQILPYLIFSTYIPVADEEQVLSIPVSGSSRVVRASVEPIDFAPHVGTEPTAKRRTYASFWENTRESSR